MNVIFYEFKKKHNSTKRATSGGTTIACSLKDDCSITNPTLKLNLGANNAPNYNYCYIEMFDRYYFVNNWTYFHGLWTCDCAVDVLATYKSEIGNSNMYVLRSASKYNGEVIDELYPTIYDVTTGGTELTDYSKVKITINGVQQSPNNLWRDNYSYGTFVVVTANDSADGVGTYLMGQSSFEVFSASLYETYPSDMGSLANGIKKSLFNPTQYIKSCFWLPFSINNTLIPQDVRDSIPLGYLTVGCRQASESVNPFTTSAEIRIELNIPDHDLKATRGDYMNSSKYREVSISLLPFGIISLPVDKLAGFNKVWCRILVDIKTGDSELFIHATDGTSYGACLYHATSKFCIDIAITGNTVDFLGAYSSMVTGLGTLAFAGTMPVFGVGGFAHSVGSINKLSPVADSKGNPGSVVAFSSKARPRVYYNFYYPTDEDLSHSGRPLCEDVKINTLSGYVLCKDGEIDLEATQTERDMVARYLTDGFFYE